MREMLLVATILVFSPCLAQAASVTIMDHNSSLKFTIDDPTFNLGVPNDPVQRKRSARPGCLTKWSGVALLC